MRPGTASGFHHTPVSQLVMGKPDWWRYVSFVPSFQEHHLVTNELKKQNKIKLYSFWGDTSAFSSENSERPTSRRNHARFQMLTHC